MNIFFLINQTLDLKNFQSFIDGIYNLNNIKKEQHHIFKKHSSVYNLNNYEKLFQNFGQNEQLVVKFIEQLSVYNEEYVDSEEKANQFCNSNINGFLGIDFSNTDIQSLKQINDDSKYKDWIYIFSNCIDNLKSIIPNYKLSN